LRAWRIKRVGAVDGERLGPDRIPGLVGVVDPAVESHHRRIVHQHIDAPAPGERLGPQAVHLRGVGEVGGDQTLSLAADPAGGRLGAGAVPAVVDDDVSAGLAQRLDDCRTDPLRSPGDQNSLSFELHDLSHACRRA
jgi:hypothetical protein